MGHRLEVEVSRAQTTDRLTEAIRGLWIRAPELSARGPGPRWLIPVLLLFAFCGAFGLMIDQSLTLLINGAVLLPIFLAGTLMRVMAAVELLRRPAIAGPRLRLMPARFSAPLPTYAVMVPLYDEAAVLPGLVENLSQLDYPRELLDIILVIEARDAATQRALAAITLPSHMRVVIVPRGGPKTKPKALNYAFAEVRSDHVVVFDAEDRPDPDQLLLAAVRFRRSSPKLACLQARLNVDNPMTSFFTRQFTLEYAALFDGLLPALERMGWPIPLGGTSNHFRTKHLRKVGAWDPYNVTEDADLGIRLARSGYQTATLASTTWEEAPTRRRIWLGQRRRWLKGWMQTWLVHMRQPGKLLKELGWWQFVGVQTVMGSVLLSALVYPVFLLLVLGSAAMSAASETPPESAQSWLWWAMWLSFFIGIGAPMLTAAIATVRRGRGHLIGGVLAMPFYWLFVSLAGYQALAELTTRPFHWEKTRHGLSASRRFKPKRGD
ncbi:MAG: glycosyltransferase [Hyphomicrobiaceae bacterium]